MLAVVQLCTAADSEMFGVLMIPCSRSPLNKLVTGSPFGAPLKLPYKYGTTVQ